MSADRNYYREILVSALGSPFTDGNRVEVLRNGKNIFPSMLGAIDEAQSQIDFLTFVYWSGDVAYQFAEKLVAKAEEGLEVRVILDSFGASYMPDEILNTMKSSGVQLRWFRPLAQWKLWKTDNRTHRKILICDGKVGFTGGVGIAEEWEGDARDPSEWRDTHFKVKGPAVHGLQAAFLENWLETGELLDLEKDLADGIEPQGKAAIQVIRTSAKVRWSDIVVLYQALISMAMDCITITTAYFNPAAVILDKLVECAERGVEIQIMVPGDHIDHRVAKIAGQDCFKPLLDAGINLWYYQKTMMHSKIITIDDEVSCVGSANFNHRSMLKDDEVNMVVIDRALNKSLKEHFEEDLEDCEQVDELHWKQRSRLQRFTELLVKPFKNQI